MLKIGYTLGDLAGIGPEIFYKFRAQVSCRQDFELVLVDDSEKVDSILKNIPKGAASSISGKHCIETLEKANKMALNGDIDYLITGPVSKESMALAGYKYLGQTEVLAALNELRSEEVEMFFVLESSMDELRCVLATRHVEIKKITEHLKLRLERVLKNSLHALEKIWKIKNPRIAVAGLNPHAGENGLIGTEEKDFIIPSIKNFNMSHPHALISGPLPADFLFAKMASNYLENKKQDYDLFIAAYHDQVLPVIKGIGGWRAINLTAGLPYVRVSVDHGTAFDIAGQGIAYSDSLHACTEFCINLQKKVTSMNS